MCKGPSALSEVSKVVQRSLASGGKVPMPSRNVPHNHNWLAM